MAKAMIKITQVRSSSRCIRTHRACVAGLGLRRIGQTVTVEDTPSIRGMINKVNYLLRVEEQGQ
ncbi:MAG: 50S ribosomal protein L30 [Halieaceae bacterium]|nr:50S ribosomal protein L30 [Halieaceae bacterium]